LNTKIIASIVTVIAVVGIIISFGITNQQESVEQEQIIHNPTVEIQNIPQIQQTYRFNTQCEMLYGMTYDQYPNGDKLPPLVLSEVVQKYRVDYAQWEDILFDDEKRIAYFENGIPVEFAQVFAQSVSKEYSINPDLHTIVMVAFLPAGTEVIENLLKENSCEDYFIEKNQ